MIRAIIFDCFGVLYTSSAEKLYSMCAAEQQIELHDIRLQRDRGITTYREYLENVATLLQTPIDEVQKLTEQLHVRNEELFQFIASVNRETCKIGMLSNIGDTTISQLFSEQELTTLFDTTVFSYNEGMVKPDPAIFRLACARIGCLPEECVMVDDIPHNCEGARSIGMQAIQYQSNTETLHLLHDLCRQ